MSRTLESAHRLIHKVITWGEIARFELDGIAGAQGWITAFVNAGVLHPAVTDTWSLSPEFWSLLREEPEKAVRPSPSRAAITDVPKHFCRSSPWLTQLPPFSCG